MLTSASDGSEIDLYIGRSIARRWRAEIAKAQSVVLVFSSYLTKAAEAVLSAAQDPACCEVHTLFDPMLFAFGASRLETFRNLANAGVSLFSVQDLHAKVVVIRSQFASVGSQNLTTAGQKRREATLATVEKRRVEAIWREVTEWRRFRRRITIEMVEEMYSRIAPLVQDACRLRHQSARIQAVIEQNGHLRERGGRAASAGLPTPHENQHDAPASHGLARPEPRTAGVGESPDALARIVKTVDSPSTMGRTATKRLGPIFELHARKNNASAQMTRATGGYLVHADAFISKTEARSLYPSAKKKRADLIQAGKVKEDEFGNWVLIEDTLFDSKSQAAYVVAGYNVSGPNKWKCKQ